MAGNVWFGMAICPSEPSRQGLGQSTFSSHVSETVGVTARRSAFHQSILAALCATFEEPGCFDSDPLSTRDLEWRLSRSAFGPTRQGRAQPVAIPVCGRIAAKIRHAKPDLRPFRPAGGEVLGRLKAAWKEEFERWQQRDLAARRYVYIWADGVYLQARMEVEKQCILVLIGATPEGKKGVDRLSNRLSRERPILDRTADGSEKQRSVGGARTRDWRRRLWGSGKRLEQQFGVTRHQRCWLHNSRSTS